MIVAHLTYDTHSLWACSFTSRSWYSAAVPHLHHTLTAKTPHYPYEVGNKKTRWPKPLRMASKFGFLPFITRVIISGSYRYGRDLSATELDGQTQREFSALVNVRELSIEQLDIPSFFPRIQQYFGQFSPTLRSLTLTRVVGSSRQVVFFLGLFPHLEDFELQNSWCYDKWDAGNDKTLIPSFVPPLRGQLTVQCSVDGIGKTMLDLFGEVRFHHMDLRENGIQSLLYACPNTLETLKLDVSDICGENPSSKVMQTLANDSTGGDSHRDLDLSRNRSLRELEITARSLISELRSRTPATPPSSFKAMLSTIRSPAFLDVVVIYRQGDFYHNAYSRDERAELGDEETWYRRQFEVFHAMREARPYRLVLSAKRVGDDSVRELRRAVAADQARGGVPLQITMSYTLRPC